MKKQKIKSEDFSPVNTNNKTKNKSNAQKIVPFLIGTIITLVVVLTCVLIAYYQVYKSGKQNANILEAVYASSYYSMVDNVNELSVDIDKYSTLTTKQAKLNLMQDIVGDCNYVVSGLSVLPINQEKVVATTKFFNQIAGMCEAYIQVLNNNQTLTQEQELLFDKISLVLEKLKQNFNKQNAGMYDTNFNFVDATIFDKTGMNELSMSMGDMSADAVEYPAMIFDGPFSTALETAVVRGLKGEEISKEQAKEYLQNIVFANRDVNIEFERETNGKISTYDYKVEVDGSTNFAQVSKVGCLLITLSGYAEGGDAIISTEQAKEIATNFVNNIGFEDMQPVWSETKLNVAYINLVYQKDDVKYYPDMVKVKVDLTSQNIIGLEAQNYALNHCEREFDFVITQTEAEENLGFDYEILSVDKAVVRLDSGKEVACFEFYLERIDGNYFYYVDATTKQIVKVLKLVETNGTQKLI